MTSPQHLCVFLCAGALVLAGTGCSRNAAADKEDASAAKQQKPVAVKTVEVTEQELRRTTLQPATVHPFYEAEIRANVPGYIQEVNADIGDAVAAGDVLAVVAVPEMDKQRLVLLARIAQQHAEEERAAAGVVLAQANVTSAEALLAQARSELKRVAASLAAAEAKFLRTSDLVERKLLEPRLLDEVLKKRDSELANKDMVMAAIASEDAAVAVSKAKLAAAEADRRAAAAETVISERQLDELDVLLNYATLTAPFPGVVTRRSVSPGDLISKSHDGQPLFIVSQLDKVRVHIPVPEADAALIDRGDAVSLTFPTFPAEAAVPVTVTRFSHSLDPSTRTMLVEAEVPNPQGRLLPGMFGQAAITLSTSNASRILPARAIRYEESGRAYVYVVVDDGVSVVPVATGINDGTTIEIVSGLEPGQMVIDAHLKRFSDGQKVRVLN